MMTMVSTAKQQPSSAFDRSHLRRMKHEAMVDAAAELFNEQGYAGTNLLELSKRLKVSKRTIYNYVQNKEELVHQCYKKTLASTFAALSEAKATEDTGLQQVRSVIHRCVHDKNPTFAILTEVRGLSEDHRAELVADSKTNRDALEGIIQKGIDDGSIGPRDPRLTAYQIFSVMTWIPTWFSRRGKLTLSQIADSLDDIFVHGLRTKNRQYTPGRALDLIPKLDRRLRAIDAPEVGSLKTTELLQAATSLFNRQGVAGTSLDDVVDSLNLTKGALYYYFDNKEDLLSSCFERTLKLTGTYLSAIEKETSNPLERYELAIRCFVHTHTGEVGPLAVFLGLDIVSGDLSKALARQGRQLERLYEKWIRESIHQGLVRKVNPVVARFALAGSLDWLPKWYQAGGPNSAQEIADSFANLLIDGLAPRSTRELP